MRVRQDRLKQYYIRNAVIRKDKEKNTYTEYRLSVSFSGVVWSASGKLQAEIYGQRITSIKNCKVDGKYKMVIRDRKVFYVLENGTEFCENDGICVYVPPESEPDYKIISIKPNRNLLMEIEKV